MREQQALPHVDSLIHTILKTIPYREGIERITRMDKRIVREPERTDERFRLRAEADMARDETHVYRIAYESAFSMNSMASGSVAFTIFLNSPSNARSCFLPGSMYFSNFWIPLTLLRKQ